MSYSQEFLQKMKGKILDEKERIDAKINALKSPESQLDNPQWDETANDAIEDVEQESLLRVYRDLQERVNNALDRIKDGAYGQCYECNTQVPEERLEQEPWAEHCSAVCSQKING